MSSKSDWSLIFDDAVLGDILLNTELRYVEGPQNWLCCCLNGRFSRVEMEVTGPRVRVLLAKPFLSHLWRHLRANVWFRCDLSVSYISEDLLILIKVTSISNIMQCNGFVHHFKILQLHVCVGKSEPAPWFDINVPPYQYRKSCCEDKMVVRSSYLHNGISFTGKTTLLYWIRALITFELMQNVKTEL